MIYLVRHGQTQYNAIGRWQGQTDSPLTELGILQAKMIALRLAELSRNSTVAIFASPLGRAHETAKIIAEEILTASEILLDARLMEVTMGSWDGLTDYEIDHEWPSARKGLDRYEWFFHSPDGETFEAMTDGVRDVLNMIHCHPAQYKIVVSHGITNRLICGIHAHLSKEQCLRLDVSQNAYFRLAANNVAERISVI